MIDINVMIHYHLVLLNKKKKSYIIIMSKKFNEILSIGCVGLIENFIAKNLKNIVAIEPDITNCKWLINNDKIKLISGYFDDVCCMKKIDFGYCVIIDYVFDNENIFFS